MISEKEARTAVHKCLREHFQGRLISETSEAENGDQSLVISWKGPGGKNKERGNAGKRTSPLHPRRTIQLTVRRYDSETTKSRFISTPTVHPLYATKDQSRSARRPLIPLSRTAHPTSRSRHSRNEGQTRRHDATSIHQTRYENYRRGLEGESEF